MWQVLHTAQLAREAHQQLKLAHATLAAERHDAAHALRSNEAAAAAAARRREEARRSAEAAREIGERRLLQQVTISLDKVQ